MTRAGAGGGSRLALGFGPQVCGSLEEASRREWLVADGIGGYAMGTVSGLRTRRYHGLLCVASKGASQHRLGLAALDPVLVVGSRRVRLATHEWAGGAVDPRGYLELESFSLVDGVPSWRFRLGVVVLEVELAMAHGQPAVEVSYRLLCAPYSVGLEVSALCTWRDADSSRTAGPPPAVEVTTDGFVFEGAYRVAGPGYRAGGACWYRNARYRVEAERGLEDHEDLWFAGTFATELAPGGSTQVQAWAGDLAHRPPTDLAAVARARRRSICRSAGASDQVGAILAGAADQHVIEGPGVVAGYPWFGPWSRDTLTSYEGLFLETGRADEGRALLLQAAGSLSDGMLVNTGSAQAGAYNSVDAALWMLHAVSRHVEVTGDVELADELASSLVGIVERYAAGTRFGIGVDPIDGLVRQGAPGVALTWMDARVGGVPITQRAGKPVEVNALYVSGLAGLGDLLAKLGRDPGAIKARAAQARQSFARRFVRPEGRGLFDVVDAWPAPVGPAGTPPSDPGQLVVDASLRPNQLIAASLGSVGIDPLPVVSASAPLVTSLGLRSLAPSDPSYRGLHQGSPEQRDAAYHQGTVWPFLVGAYVEAALRAGGDPRSLIDGLAGLEAHLGEWGLGSVSETCDGDAPHRATGCPFQAWSVAELIRARALLARARKPRTRRRG